MTPKSISGDHSITKKGAIKKCTWRHNPEDMEHIKEVGETQTYWEAQSILLFYFIIVNGIHASLKFT